MQSLIIVQSIRLIARALWYSKRIIEWVQKEDIKKMAQESQLPILGWTLLVIIIVSELLT